ncbi:MAG: hypothetical protein EJNHJLOP_00030 [Methanophagales virus PBV082]|uniref:Uncharacterized protein n=1 Tax=Methanophagales virus PBV082 TaxID=3071307 RepID=A0AA46TES8_9VIRU|nr:MAG: hypothetical protein QIT52_gp30 [Methanophagales virus PBV082]UYL64919.1 MAG: hypothetical protein EJNHJLOP_00030 [Methanophagales virus PBV082]
MRLKKEKREEMKQKIVRFLEGVNGHIASVPAIAKALQISPPAVKSLIRELEMERKVKVKMLGGAYVVQLSREVSDYE